jgi:hypothetical protein
MKEINTMLKLNINDLVHIMKQIKIAENHTATGQLVDHMGNPLNNLVPAGLRTVTGEYNNLVNLNAGASDQLMPRLSNPTWNAAEANPRTGASTSYQQLSGSVYDSQPRIISNLIADQSLTNPVAVIAALAAVGITSTMPWLLTRLCLRQIRLWPLLACRRVAPHLTMQKPHA